MAYEAFIDSDKGQPDFINEKGVEYRLEKSLTNYAKRLGSSWVVWYCSGSISPIYLLCDGQTPIHEDTQYEGICVKLDILKILQEEYIQNLPKHHFYK